MHYNVKILHLYLLLINTYFHLQIINQPDDLADVSDTDDTDTEDLTNGQLVAIGSMQVYAACRNPPCNLKKLADNLICPTCNQERPQGDNTTNITCDLGVTNNGNTFTYKAFGRVIRVILQHFGIDEQEAEDMEDAILDNLPINIKYQLGTAAYANVLSFIMI